MTVKTCLSAEEIEEIIVAFVAEDLGTDDLDEIDRDDNLLTSGLVDSVGIVRLIAHLKDRLEVTVPPQDLVPDNFRTIRIMAAYLLGRQES